MGIFWFEKPHYLGTRQVNPYYWYWHDYRCRLEPWTYEWRRHVERWPWVPIVKLAAGAGLCLWALLFPLNDASSTTKIIVLVLGVLVVAFYAWLLLHLGHFASRLWKRLRRGK